MPTLPQLFNNNHWPTKSICSVWIIKLNCRMGWLHRSAFLSCHLYNLQMTSIRIFSTTTEYLFWCFVQITHLAIFEIIPRITIPYVHFGRSQHPPPFTAQQLYFLLKQRWIVTAVVVAVLPLQYKLYCARNIGIEFAYVQK